MIRAGSGVAIIAVGNFYLRGKKTAELLEKAGIKATLINPRYISGVDEEMLEALEKDHQLVVTLEDGCLEGGFGSKISQFYCIKPMKVMNLGLKKEFVDRFKVDELLAKYHLQPEQIAADIRKNL